MLWTIVAVLAGIALAELCLRIVIAGLRPTFPWLIIAGDACPALSPDAVDRYLERSFDPELGWARKGGSKGVDLTDLGEVPFAIAMDGSRADPLNDGAPAAISVFGDSFAFCRLVSDTETWPHYLAELSRQPVKNYGVGNYGLDQAVLRMERELPKFSDHLVIIAIVPETIARIHSYWKHYFEYGNVLAFKPVFRLSGGQLSRIPPVVRAREDFFRLPELVERIQQTDPFYRSKFLADAFRGCYLWCLAKRWRRHLPILYRLIAGRLRGHRDEGIRHAFDVVFRENSRVAAKLYADTDARALFAKIVQHASELCRRQEKQLAFVVLPQPLDLEARTLGGTPYAGFVAELGATVPTLDLTDAFASHPDPHSLYLNGPLGKHTSPTGNRLIASEVSAFLARAFPVHFRPHKLIDEDSP
jgi:hypothetical protein